MKKVLLSALLMLITATSFASLNIEKISGFSLTMNSIQTIDISKSPSTNVIVFLSKDCPCSKGNLDYINELSKEFKDVRFIGVHSKKNTKAEDVIAYLQNKKLNFDVINDSDLKIADQLKALKTPHVFIVAKNGDVIYNGGVTNTTFPANAKEHFLKKALQDIHNNKLPQNPETRTLGCFISR